jgi:HSP20 family protein
MEKRKTKKVNIKTKKLKKPKEKELTNEPIIWNPWKMMDIMDKWLWDEPWTPFWSRRRWSGIIPKYNWYQQDFNINSKITAVDMVDTVKGYKITTEMPGVNKKDIEINVTENYIKICGVKQNITKEDNEAWIRRERSYSTICRTMPFPEEINPDKADATLKDGILEIIVEKKKPISQKGVNIAVK